MSADKDNPIVDLRKVREDRQAAKVQRCYCPSCLAQYNPEIDRITRQWVGRQTWWGSDATMTSAAVFYHGKLLETMPHLTIQENLVEVERFLANEFPAKFRAVTTTA